MKQTQCADINIKMKSLSLQQSTTQSTSQTKLLNQQHTLLLKRAKKRSLNPLNNLTSQTQRELIKSDKLTAKQFQRYHKVSQQLSIMQQMKKANSQKLQKLQKNISNLNMLQRLSLKQTIKFQTRKTKIQQTQSMVFYMDRLRRLKQQTSEQKLQQKRRLCQSLRESSIHNKQLSMSSFNIIKQQRLKLFREKNQKLLETHERNLEQLLQENRKKANQTKISQLRLKEKLKKYQEYKIYVGRMNYEKKLQDQYFKHLVNDRYLKSLVPKLKQEDKLYKRTERLNKQTEKIQQFYLTGTNTE